MGQNPSMGLDIDFSFEVGKVEHHQVTFHWGQTFGRILITVDGREVMAKNQALSFKSRATRKFEFTVGDDEVHAVVIEKTQKRLLGGARRQTCRAYVDGELIGTY